MSVHWVSVLHPNSMETAQRGDELAFPGQPRPPCRAGRRKEGYFVQEGYVCACVRTYMHAYIRLCVCTCMVIRRKKIFSEFSISLQLFCWYMLKETNWIRRQSKRGDRICCIPLLPNTHSHSLPAPFIPIFTWFCTSPPTSHPLHCLTFSGGSSRVHWWDTASSWQIRLRKWLPIECCVVSASMWQPNPFQRWTWCTHIGNASL